MRCKRRQEAPIERVGGRVPTHTRGTRTRTQHAVLAHNLAAAHILYTFVPQARQQFGAGDSLAELLSKRRVTKFVVLLLKLNKF